MGRSSTGVFIIAVILATGCGSNSDDPKDGPPIDTPDPGGCDGPCPACNPLGAAGSQGCDPGEKCVWEIVATSPERLGRLACVPDGTLGIGATCTTAAVGQPDGCAAGLVCVSGTCHDVCGFDGSTAAACTENFNCTRYDGVFHNGDDDPPFGACNPACDPVTQTLLTDPNMTCGAGNGCYMLTDATDTIAVCAGAGDIGHGQIVTPPSFANSCVPGAQPRRRNPTTMDIECGGLCAMTDVTSTTNMSSEGGVAPHNCQTQWGAAPPADGVNGESCRYWWARESFNNLSDYSNTVGWCFKHNTFQFDSDSDMMPDTPFPRCITLTTGDVVPPIGNPPHNDAEFFFCTALAPQFGGASFKPAVVPVLRTDRLRP